jgi:hypothetical protein
VAPDGKVATHECRAFLLDRLAEEILLTLDQAASDAAVAARLSASAGELGLQAGVEAAISWLTTAATPDTAAYLGKTAKWYSKVRKMLPRLGRKS